MSNLAQQFSILGHKQLAILEGVDLLRQAQIDLSRAQASANTWGTIAVMANVTLIPLNCIVNGLELKAANTAYQVVVRQLYDKVSKSGTRAEGHAKTGLSLLKQAIVQELKRKAMKDMIPGVNILVGLAEDSLAAWQAIQQVEAGNREINTQAIRLQAAISAAALQLLQIGTKRAEMLARMQLIARTA